MRTLCLNLPKTERPSVAETFLAFSPRVHYRAPGLVFIDVAATAQRFGGEAGLLSEVQRLTGEFFPGATAALADTPAAAQLLSRFKPFSIAAPQSESNELKDLPLSAIVHFEGLIAWRTLREVENVIDFFYGLGVKKIGDLSRFSSASLSERFGATGTMLWRRLHGRERQVISPLIPAEPLTESISYDFGVSLLPLLLHSIEKSLQGLLARLHGRREVTDKVLLHLHGEYGQRYHLLEIKLNQGTCELSHLMNMIEAQLVNLDLENPIKELTIEVITGAVYGSNSFPIIPTQARMTSGFLRPQNDAVPETNWETSDEIETILFDDLADDHLSINGQTFHLKSHSAFEGNDSPKPTFTMEQPLRLTPARLLHYKFISSMPMEKAEDGGWDTSRGRDYYIAMSPEGEPCWIYLDRIENEHYLYGY